MGPVLRALIELQSVENRLRAAKSKLSRCRRGVIIQENQLRALQNALEAKTEEIQLTRVQADRLELELKSRDERIAKYRAALNQAKSNKEYAAILTELNTSKADNAKIENQVLDLLKSVEMDEAQCHELRAEIEHQKGKLNEFRKETETQAAKFEAQIAEIQAEWDEAAKDVSADALGVFERVAETYDGEALAEVEVQDNGMGSYTCGGCFMGVTVETVNMLMTRDVIIRCPNCTRILVLKPSEE